MATYTVYDRVKETTQSTGTGTITLLGASANFRSFSLVGDGSITYYAIVHQSLNEWEVGYGTYTVDGSTLSRNVISSSNANALVSFSAGVKDVFNTPPATLINMIGGNFVIDDLSNVTITSPIDNNLLTYDSGSGEWKNQTATEAGVLTKTPSASTDNQIIPTVDNVPALTLRSYDGSGYLLVGKYDASTTTFTVDPTGVVTCSQIVSALATGTAPLTVASTTKVTNLNADLLDGRDSSYFAVASTGVTNPLSGNLDANLFKITNLDLPSDSFDAANKSYVDSGDATNAASIATNTTNIATNTTNIATNTTNITANLDESRAQTFKNAVRCVAANGVNISSLSTLQTIDGVTLVAGDRLLLTAQTTGSQNGIYIAASGSWTRATDFDSSSDAKIGVRIHVQEGTANALTDWVLTNASGYTIGTTALTFARYYNGATTTSTASAIVRRDSNSDIFAHSISASNNITATDTITATTFVGSGASLTGVQLTDTELTALASTTSAANKVPYFTGSGTATTTDLTATGRSLIGLGTSANGYIPIGSGSTYTQGAISVGTGLGITFGAGTIAIDATTINSGISAKQTSDATLTALAALTGAGTVYATATDTYVQGTLPVNMGGTASTTASGARTSLGLAIGTDVLAYSAILTVGEITLTDGATPALNAALGNIFLLTAAGDRTIAVPTNPTAGQKIIIAHLASGGARTLALNTGTNGFAYGSDITALTATASGKVDLISCVYNSLVSKWLVVSYIKGY